MVQCESNRGLLLPEHECGVKHGERQAGPAWGGLADELGHGPQSEGSCLICILEKPFWP